MLVKKTGHNTKITDIQNIIPPSNATLITKVTEIENMIPDTSGLVEKTDYNTKSTEIENKVPDVTHLIKWQTLAQN